MSSKVAICVGQDTYSASSGVPPLRGCVNDAVLIGSMLREAGFAVQQVHDQTATQSTILGALEAELARLRDGDYLVFWNSSHGYQIRDAAGDELFDYLDEAICSYDTNILDPLTDDKFQRVLGRANKNATIFIGSDSCHSGTLTRDDIDRLQSSETRLPRLWIPPSRVVSRGVELNLSEYGGLPTSRAPDAGMEVRRFGGLRKDASESGMEHLLLSGCRSDEVSWDANFPQRYHGAMSYNFATAVLQAWAAGRSITYAEAVQASQAGLDAGGYDQHPQLEGPARFKDLPVFDYRPGKADPGKTTPDPADYDVQKMADNVSGRLRADFWFALRFKADRRRVLLSEGVPVEKVSAVLQLIRT